ncbi:hypothetical protein P3S67_011179 [Capsicum chacoense]
MKRVTYPFNDKAKARIIGAGAFAGGGYFRELGYISSGSEHSGDADNDVISPSFSGLVFGFPDDMEQNQYPENENDNSNSNSGDDTDEIAGDLYDNLPEEILLQSENDLFRNVLNSHVNKALEVFTYLKMEKSVLRRNVMSCLRDFGYNAAICKAKWESSGGLTAGNYEFIDVVRTDSTNKQTRYFIDLDFASEFEIARPMKFYERLLQSLPKVYVGNLEELKYILRTMSDAGKRSLKCKGLHLPPWRKHRFMQNKWLGPYKRTTNFIPTVNTPAVNTPAFLPPSLKCRSVGFDSAAVDGGLWLPAVTRTR